MKILLTDKATLISNNDLSLDIFKEIGEVCEFSLIERKQLLEEIIDADILLCNKTVIDREAISKAKKLKYIGTFATGYNNIDINFAREKGITVCNAPEYSTNAVAQQVMAYILMHYTKVHEYNTFVKNNGWKKSAVFSPLIFPTGEVYGKNLGIVGFGSIGKAVARAAIGLGMNVLVYTRTPKNDSSVKFVNMDELLKESDILTLHCPLNEQTENLMNSESFNKMKDGAFFINTSRGGTVDEQALKQALLSGKLSGAAIDVLKQEPMHEDCDLAVVSNLVITPHSAWAPLDTRKRLVSLVAENIYAFLNGKPQNVVN